MVAYPVIAVATRRKAAVIPVPVGVDKFTKILFLKLTVGVVEDIYTAALEKPVPVLDPFK